MTEDTAKVVARGAAPDAGRWPGYDMILLALLLVTTVALLRIAFYPVIDADEIEHAHATWALGQGVLPYRDLHQIHLPLLWMMVSPILSMLPESAGSLFVLRALCLGATALACVAGVLCLRELVASPTRAQVLCVILVAVGMAPLSQYYRYRPDPFMSMFVAWSLLAVLRLPRNPARYAFLAGAALGLAAAFSTKMVPLCLMVPLLCVVESIRVRDWRPLLIGLPNLAGFIAAVLPVALWLVYQGISSEFVEWTIVHNSEMVRISSAVFGYLSSTGPRLPVFVTFAMVGAAVALAQALRGPAVAWSPRVGLLIAIGLAWMVRAIEANHYDYNVQVMVIPVAVAVSLALGAMLAIPNRVVALVLLIGSLGIFLYQPVVTQGLRMRLTGIGVKVAELDEMIRVTREPGATCIGFAPYHPVFCRNASQLYLTWDFMFLKMSWMTPAGRKRYREMWPEAVRVAQATKPTLIVDSGLWQGARKREAITAKQYAQLRRLLVTDYTPIKMGFVTTWVRSSTTAPQLSSSPLRDGPDE